MGVFSRYRSALIAAAIAILSSQVTAHAASVLFSAAGPRPASIQASVDAFRLAVGNPNNGNLAGELAGGRREINWDGGGVTTIATTGTPLINAFENTRGALFSTPGTGFTQAPAIGGGAPGLETVFG